MKDFRRQNDGQGWKNDRGYTKYQGPNGPVRPEGQVKHRATCAECGNMCEVPFRPNGKKPVFCPDCFGAKRDGGYQGFKKDFAPRAENRAPAHQTAAPAKDHRIDEIKAQLGAIGTKLDRLIAALEKPAAKAEAPAKETAKPAVKLTVKAAPKKAAKPAPAKKSKPAKAAKKK